MLTVKNHIEHLVRLSVEDPVDKEALVWEIAQNKTIGDEIERIVRNLSVPSLHVLCGTKDKEPSFIEEQIKIPVLDILIDGLQNSSREKDSIQDKNLTGGDRLSVSIEQLVNLKCLAKLYQEGLHPLFKRRGFDLKELAITFLWKNSYASESQHYVICTVRLALSSTEGQIGHISSLLRFLSY